MAKTSKNVRLTPKQTTAIESLLSGASIVDAATTAGVTRQTVHLWLKEPLFKDALESAQRETVRTTTRKLSSMLGASVAELERIMTGGEDENTRLRAALAVPVMLRDLREHGELEERLASIERELMKHEPRNT